MEVCVDSVESAVNAESGGASRVELCSDLVEGGITPSLGLLRQVKKRVKLPVYVMLRPRGGDFVYSDEELEVMKDDLRLMKENGADGIVFGILKPDGAIDKENCSQLLKMSAPLPATFHRAFDMTSDLEGSLELIISLGFQRVLTSGGDSSALEGLPMISKLIKQSKNRIVIVPGGGITEHNLKRVLEGSGASEFHCSARGSKSSKMEFRNTAVSMGASYGPPEYVMKLADTRRVECFIEIAKSVWQD